MNITMEKKGVKYLKKLLFRFNCLSKEQAITILKFYGDENAHDTLDFLIKSRHVFELSNGAIAATPKGQYNENAVLAIWIFLKFLGDVDFEQCYLAQEPSSIFFLKDNNMYEVIVVPKGREAQTMYAANYHNQGAKEIRYVVLLFDMEQLDTIDREASQYDLDVAYALFTGYDVDGAPLIKFMKKQ